MKTLTVVPAYGRDYDSAAAAADAWAEDKDFRIADVSSPFDGKWVNRPDLRGNDVTVKLRYKGLARFVLISPDGTVTPDFTEDEDA